MTIHATAIVAEKAIIGKDVTIGAYCVIGEEVVIGDGTRLDSHVVINGKTIIGKDNHLHSFVSLGNIPQDLKFDGEVTELIIGDNNDIREYVTMNLGTKGGGEKTVVGNGNLFMVSSHVGHDCIIGDDCVIANCVALGGHVEVGDHAIIGGLSAVHQYRRIGRYAMVGGMSAVVKDVIPFGLVNGNRAQLENLNLIGLKRRNFSKEIIRNLLDVYKYIFISNNGDGIIKRTNTIENDKKYKDIAEVKELLEFIKSAEKGLCTAENGNDND